MKKVLGILVVLVAIILFTSYESDAFLRTANLENLTRRIGLFGIIGVGVAFVIVTKGIDLSIGSVVCLTGIGLPWLLVRQEWSPGAAITMLITVSLLIGLTHGLLITKLKLQPFVVTLCGLLIYRGVTRGVTNSQSQGFKSDFEGLRQIALGKLPTFPVFLTLVIIGFVVLGLVVWRIMKSKPDAKNITLGVMGLASIGLGFGVRAKEFLLPMPCLILAIISLLAAVFFHRTVWGRHLLALGNNEEAARFSGIATDRLIILAYVVCALLSGIGGMLFVMDVGSGQPSDFGNFYELYAIAAAVIGGCSLRGGEVSVMGVVLGTALMQVIRNMIVLVYPEQQQMEFAVIGVVILVGVIIDEALRRMSVKRKLAA